MAWPGDRHISYLPLAHIYERVTLVGVTHGGVSIGFYRCLAQPMCLQPMTSATCVPVMQDASLAARFGKPKGLLLLICVSVDPKVPA